MALLRTLLALSVLFFSASINAAPLRVVVSFSILEDWVQVVGGTRVEVIALVGRGGDAHSFRPAPSDVKKIAGADLLVVNGLGFEGWLPRLIDASGYRGDVLIASDGIQAIETARRHIGNHGSHSKDPHAWHSVKNAQHYVRNIERALLSLDAENAEYYAQNTADYLVKLDALQSEYERAFLLVPAEKRKVVTAHDAFEYLAADYAIELFAPQASSVGIGSSAKRVAALIESIRRDNIRAVFLENVADPRLLQQVSEETGVAIGGYLYSDALSNSAGEAPSYLRMMRHNLQAILKALR